MKTPARRQIAAAALLFTAPVFAACAQGFGAQTDQQYQPVEGISAHVGGINIDATAVVASEGSGKGTLSTTIVSDDKKVALTSVSGDGVTTSGLPVTIPENTPVKVENRGVVVSGDSVEPGGYVKLTFTFDDGESTSMTVPVVTQSGDYQGVPLPSESPSPSASASPSSSGSPSPSGSESPSPSPSASASTAG